MNIEQEFNYLQKKFPHQSTYTSFACSVAGSKTDTKDVEFLFDKLVEKGDYRRGERNEVLEHLQTINMQN